MRSLSFMALVCCASQSSFASQTQSLTHSATLSQTSKTPPIAIKTLDLKSITENTGNHVSVGSPATTSDIQLLIEPATATAGSPSTSIASSVESEGSHSARANKSPLDSGRLTIDSEAINPLPDATVATSTTESIPTRAATTVALALAIPTTASSQTTERARTAEETQAPTTSAPMSPTDFGPVHDLNTAEVSAPLERGMIGYNTELNRTRSNSHPACVRKSNSSPDGFVMYPCPPRND